MKYLNYIYGHTLSDGAGEYLDENLLTNKFVNSSPQKKKKKNRR